MEAASEINLKAVLAEDVEAAATTAVGETTELSLAALENASAAIPLSGDAAPGDSLIAFWESEPEPVFPQPLTVLSSLDEAWGDPEPRSSATAAVVVYPLVIVLMMFWALVQVLLLGGKALCWLLTGLAERLDAFAQERLQRRRESALGMTEGLAFAIP